LGCVGFERRRLAWTLWIAVCCGSRRFELCGLQLCSCCACLCCGLIVAAHLLSPVVYQLYSSARLKQVSSQVAVLVIAACLVSSFVDQLCSSARLKQVSSRDWEARM
jgi:hypothetical protein